MSKHAGEPVEEPPPSSQRNRLLLLGSGITATVIAWGYLVSAAIGFGSHGRDGEAKAWFFLAFATIGATACMFAFLILASKVWAAMRGEAPPPPRGSGGGRRASR